MDKEQTSKIAEGLRDIAEIAKGIAEYLEGQAKRHAEKAKEMEREKIRNSEMFGFDDSPIGIPGDKDLFNRYFVSSDDRYLLDRYFGFSDNRPKRAGEYWKRFM